MDLFENTEGRKALRYYQDEAAEACVDNFKKGVPSVMIMATGTGKTVVGSEILRRLDVNTLWLAHRDNLLESAINTIHQQTGYRPHKEKAAEWASSRAKFVCGSVQTMQNSRLERFGKDFFKLGVIDEAHHAVAKTYQNIIKHFGFYNLGLTATPDRADQKELSGVYKAVAYEYPLHKAIKEGFLVPIRGYKVEDFEMDLSQLRVVAGDYQDKDLENIITKYMNPIAASVKEQTGGMKSLLFLPTVESSRLMAEILNKIGVEADYVAGNKDNRKAFYDFKNGNISHLCTCNLVFEGYDEPSIECVIMLRPTGSRTVYAQAVGRGTRLYPGKKELKLVEFTYNSSRLKLVKPFELFSTAGFGERVQDFAEKNLATSSGIDYLEALEYAAEKFYSVDGIVSRLIKPVKGYSFTTFDPVSFGDLLGVDITGEFDITYQGRKLTGRSTDKQREILSRYGIAAGNDIDKAQASALIGTLFDREIIPFKGKADKKQVEILRKFGVEGAEKMMKAQASMLIAEINKKMKTETCF